MSNVTVATKLPSSLAEKVDKKINEGKYLNRSDFLRVAARNELKEEA